MPHYVRIASKVFDRPLMILPSQAQAIGDFLAARIHGGAVPELEPQRRSGPAASRFEGESVGVGDREEGFWTEFYRRVGSVGLVTVEGELVNRGAWIGASSGITSYEGVMAQLTRAANDPKVSSIVLDIDSPGGEAVGAMEFAAFIRKLNAVKPVTAIANGMAASAAYAFASGAGRLLTIPSGIVGSIGVVMLHLDQSARLEQAGVKPTLIFSGDHKVDGNPFEALPEAVRADLQAEVDGFYQQFVASVAAGRPGLSEDAIRATQARIFVGDDAVKAGLADGISTLDELVAELNRSGARALPASPRGHQMKDSYTQAELDEARTEAHASGHAAGKAEGAAEGRAAALADVAAITGSEEAKGREAQALVFALEGIAPPAATKALAASPKGASSLASRASSEPIPPVGGSAQGGGRAAAPVIDAKAIYAGMNRAG
jgi:signal peptide peptidase SppA